jgi:hypothetical protein
MMVTARAVHRGVYILNTVGESVAFGTYCGLVGGHGSEYVVSKIEKVTCKQCLKRAHTTLKHCK